MNIPPRFFDQCNSPTECSGSLHIQMSPSKPKVIKQCTSDTSPSLGIQRLSCRDTTDDYPLPVKRMCSDPTLLQKRAFSDGDYHPGIHIADDMKNSGGQFQRTNESISELSDANMDLIKNSFTGRFELLWHTVSTKCYVGQARP